ncbi:MAG: molybdopterin-guanine dinucleotide biosynthesis protein B [Bacillota bacterium]
MDVSTHTPTSPSLPPVILLVGWSGSGKTTLMEKLVAEVAGRGLRVATVKHDAHGFEMDHPGKDTWRHRRAGAVATAISSPTGFALVEQRTQERPLEDILPLLVGADIILVEGYKNLPYPKLEVIGTDGRQEPACLDDPLLFAVAGDTPRRLGVPCLSRDDAAGIARLVLQRAGLL